MKNIFQFMALPNIATIGFTRDPQTKSCDIPSLFRIRLSADKETMLCVFCVFFYFQISKMCRHDTDMWVSESVGQEVCSNGCWGKLTQENSCGHDGGLG